MIGAGTLCRITSRETEVAVWEPTNSDAGWAYLTMVKSGMTAIVLHEKKPWRVSSWGSFHTYVHVLTHAGPGWVHINDIQEESQ